MRHIRHISMVKGAAVLIVLIADLSAASLTHVEDVPLARSWSRMRVAKWSHGALLNVEYHDTANPLIWLFTRNDQQAVPFTIPDTRSMLIYDWDRGADGTIGISGVATDADGRSATFVAWISADRTSSKVIRTSAYRPAMVAVAPDGTLWTAGSEFITKSSGGISPTLVPNAGVIQHFDKSGSTLGTFVPQSTVQNPVSLSRSRNTLRASKDRIAWYSAEGRYIEIAMDGRILTDISVQVPDNRAMDENTGFALTDDGDAFLSASYSDASPARSTAKLIGIYILDRSAREWKPVSQPSQGIAAQPGSGYIYGAEGNRLILQGNNLLKFYNIEN